MYDYDVVVIGAGSGGLVACKLANGLGKRTALVEGRKIGGDCTWFGCVPSKTLIRSAHVAHQTKRLQNFGLQPKGPIEFDARDVMAHVRAVVEKDAATHPPESYEAEGINVLLGAARFLDPHTIQVGERTVSSSKFVLCTGSRPFVPPIEGLQDVPYLTNETIFFVEALPRSMLVLGAGPIGIEMAAALNRLGVHVTVLQRSGEILRKDDQELATRLLELLRAEGVEILLETEAVRFSQSDRQITADLEGKAGNRQVTAESVLVSVGRVPNVDNLDLEKAGVEYHKKGVKVDKHLRTTARHIYAAGDIVPPYLFTHVAEYEAVIATTNACFGLPIRRADYDNILWATFTEPELAHAGLTETEARERYGDSIRVYRWQFKDVDRGKTDLAEDGMSKFVCDRKGRLLGIHILGHAATELMHEAQLAKSLGKPFSKIASVIHAYPSYSDAVRQPAKRCYVDLLQSNPFVRLVKRFRRGEGE
jgi:pyruvate/2-oxoglutarate dehydrogenase complex dihydrolipoamide dehydrogenase (E3) component